MKDILNLIWFLISTIALSKITCGAVNLFLRPCMKGLAPLGVFFFGVVMWMSWDGVIAGLGGSLLHWFSWIGKCREFGPSFGFRFELAAGG